MNLQEIKSEIDSFNKKLKFVESVAMSAFKLKAPLKLTIEHCTVKWTNEGDHIVITHPDMRTIVIPEKALDNFEEIKKHVAGNVEQAEREKKIYDLKWQIDYWSKQLNQETINKKLEAVELMKQELISLESKGVQ